MSQPLLVFAHKKEAAFFFKNYPYRRSDMMGIKVYQSSDHCLLIAGEGYNKSASALKKTLEYFDPKPDIVINLGLAGSLDRKKARLKNIYPVKTLGVELSPGKYADEKIETDSQTGLDCLSVLEPVLDPAYAKKLAEQFDLVDMECWGVAGICKQENIPFYAYKIISDYAGYLSKAEMASHFSQFSELLYNFYRQKIVYRDLI